MTLKNESANVHNKSNRASMRPWKTYDKGITFYAFSSAKICPYVWNTSRALDFKESIFSRTETDCGLQGQGHLVQKLFLVIDKGGCKNDLRRPVKTRTANSCRRTNGRTIWSMDIMQGNLKNRVHIDNGGDFTVTDDKSKQNCINKEMLKKQF